MANRSESGDLSCAPARHPSAAEVAEKVAGHLEPRTRADLFWHRLFEFIVLFVTLPIAFMMVSANVRMLIPVLVATGTVVFLVLWLDPTFDRRRLVNAGALRRELPTIAALGLLGGAGILVAVWLFEERGPFWLPANKPLLWAAIMVGYPVFSVYPQELMYRAFLMHRYRPVFPGRWMMIAASGAAFGFAHIVLENWVAVAMTMVGGVLFAWRYDRARSVAAVWLEHALWGCLIFTIGLGSYFVLDFAIRR